MGLSFLDKTLSIWILICMVVGVVLGYYVPNIKNVLEGSTFADVSIPIAIGLLWMMYPVLCKIKYEELKYIFKDKNIIKQLLLSLFLNWIISPLFMLALSWATLPDLPEYRTGLILVGTARCIAMVLIWNDLSGGSPEYCAILVAINSILQIALYGPLSYFYIVIVSKGSNYNINIWPIVRSVLVFLGIPLLAGIITRVTLRKINKKWYDEKFIKFIGPTSLLGLLFTIIIMFASQGHDIIENIGNVFRVMVPLILYFFIIFFITLFICYKMCIPYIIAVPQCFTAASNNFELAIAVAISTYGINSKEALAATIGPLVEVPVLVILVYVIRFLNKTWYSKKIEKCDDDRCKLTDNNSNNNSNEDNNIELRRRNISNLNI